MKRRVYLRDPTKSIPRTTLWRMKKRESNELKPSHPATSESESTIDLSKPKRRKLYNRDPIHPVPKQTIWSASKTRKCSGDSKHCNSSDDPDDEDHGGRDRGDGGGAPGDSDHGSGSDDNQCGGRDPDHGSGSDFNLDGGDGDSNHGGGDRGDDPGDGSSSDDDLGGGDGDSDHGGSDGRGDPGDSDHGGGDGRGNPGDGSSSDDDLGGGDGGSDHGGGDWRGDPGDGSSSDDDLGGGDGGSDHGDGDWRGDPGDSDHGSSSDDNLGDCGRRNDETFKDGDNERVSITNAGMRTPLYNHAPLTAEESMYATYLYAIRNKLSYQATSQLLDLMRIHLPAPNCYPRSFYALKKHISGMATLTLKKFCSTCLDEIPKENKRCNKRECKHSSLCHYAVLPFQEHLEAIYSDKWDQLQYPFTRERTDGKVQDIQDGEAYLELTKPGGFLAVPEHTGLILCSDGVQLFKSSKRSIWPILLTVTSLPPGIRMNAENIILAGIWQGPTKPPMKLILSPVLDKINDIKTNGIPVYTPGGPRTVRACLLLAVFDLPAKAMATNITQYNGYYSCTYCLDKGEHLSRRQLFYPEDEHEPRTKDHLEDSAKEAEETGTTVFGVKGKSVLSSHVDITESVPVDYMHAALEGVTKALLSTYLDSKFHTRRFYLGASSTTKEIDRRLNRIKPPQEFRRTPRSITSYKQWKASEFRAWLLYYSLPVLSGLLPVDYIYHLSLFVSAMHILLNDTLSLADIDLAHSLLDHFYKLTPQLYPIEICTMNLHSLIHLAQFVRSWGPLWCYSCFGFESMNGHLRKNCHGTRLVLTQLIHNVRMRQLLPVKCKMLASSATPMVSNFIKSLTDCETKNVQYGIEVKGRVVHKQLDESTASALLSAGFIDTIHPLPTLPVCERIRHNSTLYSITNDKQRARDGSICIFKYQSTLLFGSIIKFCFARHLAVAIVRVFNLSERSILDTVHAPTLSDDALTLCSNINKFIFCVKKLSLSNRVVAIPASAISLKCVHIPQKGSPLDFIITLPNLYEHH